MGYNKYITIKQKARAYDELIKKAQDVLHTSEFINIIDLFPEFEMDKDEMIKNFICNELACLRATDEKGSDRYNELTEAIAWIEKQDKKESQGKSALKAWKEMRLEVYAQASGNRHEPNYSDDSTKMFSLTDIDEIFEKIAETQDEYTADPCYNCDHQVLSCNDFPCEKKQSVQKYNTNSLINNVWSEEDEKMIRGLIVICDEWATRHSYLPKENNDIEKIKSWLKSLRPQPKQEWSEEDKEMLDGIILRCEKYGYQEQIDWLKSLKPQKINPRFPQYGNIVDKVFGAGNLETWEREEAEQLVLLAKEEVEKALRPQNHWKPSDEQITWLYRAVDNVSKDSRMKQVLNDLLSDLKKLKEE